MNVDELLKTSKVLNVNNLVKKLKDKAYTCDGEFNRITILVNCTTWYETPKKHQLTINFDYDTVDVYVAHDTFISPLNNISLNVMRHIKDGKSVEKDELLPSEEFKKYIKKLKKAFPHTEIVLFGSMWDKWKL